MIVRMPLRRFLILFVPSALVVVAGLGVYLYETWPHLPPDYSKVPFKLNIEGVRGIKLYLQAKDVVITPTIIASGRWEPAETAQFVKTVKPGDTFVDAGANIGYYTLIGSRLVGAKGKVYAFEPDPTNFAILQRNVQLNRLSNVVLEQKALSNHKGVLKLYIAEQNKGDHRIYQPEGESRPSVEVEAVRLDEYMKGQGRRPDVLKMDTQGAEGQILEGMSTLFENRTDGPTIFMEFWPHGLKQMGINAGSLVDLLQSYHYQFFDLNNAHPERGLTHVDPKTLYDFPVDEYQSADLLLVRRGSQPAKVSLGRTSISAQ